VLAGTVTAIITGVQLLGGVPLVRMEICGVFVGICGVPPAKSGVRLRV